MDEEDLGFDGPDIRPPQATKGPTPGGGVRNFGSGRTDRDRRQGYNGNYGGNSNQRSLGTRNNQAGVSRERQGSHRQPYGSLGHRGTQNIHVRDKMSDK